MANPCLQAVISSSIAAWGWLNSETVPDTVKLFVEFKGGKIYEYHVPVAVALELKIASSKGTYINKMKESYIGSLVSNDYVCNAFDCKPTVKTSMPLRIILGAREMMAFTNFC
jgi:hypothetical protein